MPMTTKLGRMRKQNEEFPLKMLKTAKFLKAAFHKFYLVHS